MADLTTTLLPGLTLKHPVLPCPGPNVAGASEAIAAVQGGASAAVLQTVTKSPAAATTDTRRAAYGKDGAWHRSPLSSVPFATWLDQEFAPALEAARASGVPCIPSVSDSPEAVLAMGERLAALGADALVLDTHWMDRAAILPALRGMAGLSVPVIVKLSPHHGEDLADLAAELEPWAAAYLLIGSFGPVLAVDGEQPDLSPGLGFLSGAPIRPIAQRFVFEVARRVSRPIIAAGGIASGQDAVTALMAGATAMMVSTAAIAGGPATYGRIAREMAEWLDRHGYRSAADVRGAYIRKWGGGQRVVVEKEEAPQLLAEACIKCTFCETVCFYDAITAPVKTLPTIRTDPCFECGLCVSACPTGALRFRPRETVTRFGQEGEGERWPN
jgi:dihydroorotate dehydrogenase/NAD-dependent dihydropyrimidine dehydrogenase PreA subunit